MPMADVYNIDRQKVSEIELNDAVFGSDVNRGCDLRRGPDAAGSAQKRYGQDQGPQ